MAKELKLSSVKLRLGQKISPGGNRGRQESKGVNQIKIYRRKLSPRYSQEHLQLNGEKIRPNWCSQSQIERRQHISKVGQENTEVWNYGDKAHLLNLLMNDAWKFKGTSSVGHLSCRNQPASLSNQHKPNFLQPIDWEHWNSLLFHKFKGLDPKYTVGYLPQHPGFFCSAWNQFKGEGMKKEANHWLAGCMQWEDRVTIRHSQLDTRGCQKKEHFSLQKVKKRLWPAHRSTWWLFNAESISTGTSLTISPPESPHRTFQKLCVGGRK